MPPHRKSKPRKSKQMVKLRRTVVSLPVGISRPVRDLDVQVVGRQKLPTASAARMKFRSAEVGCRKRPLGFSRNPYEFRSNSTWNSQRRTVNSWKTPRASQTCSLSGGVCHYNDVGAWGRALKIHAASTASGLQDSHDIDLRHELTR